MDVRFGESVIALVDWAFVWRESLEDGDLWSDRRPADPDRAAEPESVCRYSSPAVTVTWNATRHATVLASYVHFFAGPFLKETPPGKDMDYFTLWVDYTF